MDFIHVSAMLTRLAQLAEAQHHHRGGHGSQGGLAEHAEEHARTYARVEEDVVSQVEAHACAEEHTEGHIGEITPLLGELLEAFQSHLHR